MNNQTLKAIAEYDKTVKAFLEAMDKIVDTHVKVVADFKNELNEIEKLIK